MTAANNSNIVKAGIIWNVDSLQCRRFITIATLFCPNRTLWNHLSATEMGKIQAVPGRKRKKQEDGKLVERH